MAKHTEIGTNGEQVAVNFLKNKGYLILARNWRCGHKEIDIIASDGDDIVFVEVKARTGLRLGFPEEAVTEAKKNKLKAAATAYMETIVSARFIRFDIISIVFRGAEVAQLLHLQDAFY